MTTPGQDVATILASNGAGMLGTASSGWSIFRSNMPNSPHKAIMVKDTGGFDSSPKFSRDRPTVQVMIRGDVGDFDGAFIQAQLVQDILLGRGPEMVGSVRIVGIWAVGGLIDIGDDDSGRPRISSNYRLVREPPASGNRV